MYEQRQVYFRFGPRISPMIKKIIIITSAVFILQLILGLASGKRISFLEQVFALVPFSAVLRFELWRFVTYAFLHGGPFHVLFNMLGLYFFGPDIERNLGSGKHFLIFYCAAALTGGICQTGLAFAVGKQVPAIPIIGASAAVMAVIVAAAIYTPDRMVILFIFPMKLKHLAFLFVGMDIIYVLQDARSGGGSVARLAHLGGAGFGFLYIKLLPHIKKYLRSRAQAVEYPDEEKKRDDKKEMDRILAKIHSRGMSSLTEQERRFLMEQSRDSR